MCSLGLTVRHVLECMVSFSIDGLASCISLLRQMEIQSVANVDDPKASEREALLDAACPSIPEEDIQFAKVHEAFDQDDAINDPKPETPILETHKVDVDAVDGNESAVTLCAPPATSEQEIAILAFEQEAAEIAAERVTKGERDAEDKLETKPASPPPPPIQRRLFNFIRQRDNRDAALQSKIQQNLKANAVKTTELPPSVHEVPNQTEAVEKDSMASFASTKEKGDVLKRMVSCLSICLTQKPDVNDDEHEEYAPLFHPDDASRKSISVKSSAASCNEDPQIVIDYHKLDDQPIQDTKQ